MCNVTTSTTTSDPLLRLQTIYDYQLSIIRTLPLGSKAGKLARHKESNGNTIALRPEQTPHTLRFLWFTIHDLFCIAVIHNVNIVAKIVVDLLMIERNSCRVLAVNILDALKNYCQLQFPIYNYTRGTTYGSVPPPPDFPPFPKPPSL